MTSRTSRDLMLARIRTALGEPADRAAQAAQVDPAAPVEVPRAYDHSGSLAPGSDAVVDLFVERLLDYRADVEQVGADGLDDALIRMLASSSSVVVPAGLAGDLRDRLSAAGIRVIVDEEPRALSALELDEIGAVVTGATVAIAVNGTIVLDASPDQGRRIISLVPDLHVVILRRSQIVETMPEAIAHLTPERPTTFIAGPSATSDIELNRVEGVHGPRTLRVLVVGEISPQPHAQM